MKQLRDILYKVNIEAVEGDTSTAVNEIRFDSRKAGEGDVFVAVRGAQVDGHKFIPDVLDKGVVAVVCEKMPDEKKEDVVYVQVKDSSSALGYMASNFYGNPSSKLKLVGVTGTNGKTTTVSVLHELFLNLGYNVGLLSTVENKINDRVIATTHTTPDPVTINQLFSEMLSEGCTHCFMEVSSHAVVQNRITGLTFTGAVFTNISHDHLDYHKTFDAYISAKKRFFDELPGDAFALINSDDRRGNVMVQNTRAEKHFYGLTTMADFKGKLLSNTFQGLELDINDKSIWFRLIGSFNAYNLLAAYGVAILLEEEEEEVLTALSQIGPTKGRFERIISPGQVVAIIDYAHTPDALENVLKTIHNIKEGDDKIITVVGCGGNRDAEKRPLMASLSCRFSDKVILTSDNPRNEDPEEILRQMEGGVNPSEARKVLKITDRREAIKTACSIAEKGDIILVAGKGHETYQEVKGERYHFDDKEIVEEIFQMLHK